MSDTKFKKGMIPWNKGLKLPNQSGANNHRWKGGDIKLKCTHCGKEYYKERGSDKRSRFCSRACRAKFHHSGEKHWKWKGGISSIKDKLKSSEPYMAWRLKVFQRDWFTCKLCGYRGKKSKAHGDKTSDIHAHHIEPIRDNYDNSINVENGITLCVPCHRLTYGKENKFAMVFKEILNDYMKNKTKV